MHGGVCAHTLTIQQRLTANFLCSLQTSMNAAWRMEDVSMSVLTSREITLVNANLDFKEQE